MLIAIGIGLGSVFVGLTAAYYANLAPGGAIVLVAAGAFALTSTAAALR
jgi:ABC-type Mn2+/Zn2+ transport system permease subunit